MQDADLCDQTFLVWAALLKVVEEEDLGYLIDQTFALIVQNWSHFSEETQLQAYGVVDNLIKIHNRLLRERINSLPSLSSIPMMQKFDEEISRLKAMGQPESHLLTFSHRCDDENAVIVGQALNELAPYLEANQKFLHDSAISDKPSRILSTLTRSLLDASVRFAEDYPDITVQCARCLGIIGCLDPHRVEAVREKREMLVLSNFERATEVIDFSAFFLERVLVKVFYATTNARAQGFLAYVMQELLRFCGFNQIAFHRPRSSQPTVAFQKWMEIPESVRSTLTPFLSSKYMIRSNAAAPTLETYPIFAQGLSHSEWLRSFVYDLLQRGKGENPQMIFPVLAKIIKGHDLSISSFILPFAALNVVVSGEDQETTDIGQEFLTVLQAEIQPGDPEGGANIKQCSEVSEPSVTAPKLSLNIMQNVFQVLDYFAHWLQEKRKAVSEARNMSVKTGRGPTEMEQLKDISQISCVERILQSIPAEIISKRAVECGSFARALFHWEQYIRQEKKKFEAMNKPFVQDELLERLQFIYAQIDEPDSIEGISAHLRVLNPEQQIMEHRKAGRWTAAQSWYELSLADKPDDSEAQINLLTCLKESGQYGKNTCG
jgi:serine/threonine-protein kinase ATR